MILYIYYSIFNIYIYMIYNKLKLYNVYQIHILTYFILYIYIY